MGSIPVESQPVPGPGTANVSSPPVNGALSACLDDGPGPVTCLWRARPAGLAAAACRPPRRAPGAQAQLLLVRRGGTKREACPRALLHARNGGQHTVTHVPIPPRHGWGHASPRRTAAGRRPRAAVPVCRHDPARSSQPGRPGGAALLRPAPAGRRRSRADPHTHGPAPVAHRHRAPSRGASCRCRAAPPNNVGRRR
jgi:hypothetical protein